MKLGSDVLTRYVQIEARAGTMLNQFWAGCRVAVTGAAGFIGSHVTELLVERGAIVTAVIHPAADRTINLGNVLPYIDVIAADLTNADECLRACAGQDVVLSIAHVDGSVAFKRDRPAFIFRQNMLITLHMLEAVRRCGVDRMLLMSSAEVYAPEAESPTPESSGFQGAPSAVTAGYAWSKRMTEFAAEVYNREYGLKVALARPSNVYGPRDYADGPKGRVIPNFISQAFHSDKPITIWGSGNQLRSFLYVTDLARGLLDLVEKYPQNDPVNFASTNEVTIKQLAELIVQLSGRDVPIVCDETKPEGPARRIADVTKARQILDFEEKVALDVGLQETVAAYREQLLVKKAA